MTTKEEKARLKSIRMLLVEIVQEVDEMLGLTGKPVLNVGRMTGKGLFKENIEKLKEAKEEEPKGPMKIGDLNIGDTGIIIEGEILDITRDSGIKRGRAWEGLKVSLNDGSGPIKLVLWNEQIADFGNLQVNDVVRVEAWKVEKGYKGGVFELVYGKFGTINKVNIERHII